MNITTDLLIIKKNNLFKELLYINKLFYFIKFYLVFFDFESIFKLFFKKKINKFFLIFLFF